MKIEFIKASDLERNVKCTIHKNGKLGFTEAAIKKLNLETNRFIKIGTNEEDKNDTNLYMVIQSEGDEYSFKANKAGNYFYINTKALFDKLEIDYRKHSIIYDIVECKNDEGNLYYKLIKREKDRKSK